MSIEQEIQNILDRNFTRGDNAKALKELLVLYNVVKPKRTVCDHKKVQPYFAPVDECEDCGELIRQ